MENKKTGEKFERFVYLFLFFAMVGWLYEVFLAFVYGYGFINRGFLVGPYLPLYGFGALLLITVLDRLLNSVYRLGRVQITPVLVFLAVVVITTVLEYVTGYVLELIFHQRWWDYSTYKYQLHGRISLSASIRFGFGGLLFLYILLPVFNRIIDLIPEKYRKIMAIAIIVILILDLLLTLYLAAVKGFNPELAKPR